VCVTAAVALSPRYRARTVEFLRATQLIDGSWPSYWWCDDAYATALAARALRAQGDTGDRRRLGRAVAWAGAHLSDNDGSAFATAYCVDLVREVPEARVAAVARLLECQRSDGSWPPSARLRVPYPDTVDPGLQRDWVPGGRIEGSVVLDDQAIFTTATALAALTSPRRNGRPT
jgi:hypothetical protein